MSAAKVRTAADLRAGGDFAGSPLVVVALCAVWCTTCDEFRKTLDRLATRRPHVRFVWLDIEDDSDIVGDIDVENFPTLAIFRGRKLLHFGVSLPHEGNIARLVDALADARDEAADAPVAARELARLFEPRA
jgi:thioredoxin reductase (NADPH)